MNIDYLKSNGVDVDSSLELLGDIETYNEILETFINDSKKKVERLKKNKDIKNLEDYVIYAHSLKSDSRYLGFKELADVSYNHELKSKEGDIDYIENNFDILINEYNRIMDIVNKYMGG